MKLAFASASLLALACASSTHEVATPRADVMTRAEIAIGKVAGALEEFPAADAYPDVKLSRYVSALGKRLARRSERPALPWTFSVLDSPDVDARAYPGGRIVITRGALAVLGSEAELAGVLAHEVAHVSSRHADPAWRPDFPVLGGADALRREALRDADHERQADALAVRYLRSEGYDTRGLAVALARFTKAASHGQTLDDPHPSPDARASRLAVLAGDGEGTWGRERYLAQIRGLALGPGRHAPRLVGRRWIVPNAITLDVPAELQPASNGNLLEAKAIDGSSLTAFAFTHPGLLSRSFHDGLRSLPHTVSELLGHPVYSIRSTENATSVVLVDRGDVSLLLIATEEILARVLGSATLTGALPEEPRISVHRATRRMRLDELLDTSCPDTPTFEAERLNGISAGTYVRAGWLVKCVTPNSIAEARRRK